MSEQRERYSAAEACYTAAEVEQAMIEVDEAIERIDDPITARTWRGMVLSRLQVNRFVSLAEEAPDLAGLEAVLKQARAELTEGQHTAFLGRTIRGAE